MQKSSSTHNKPNTHTHTHTPLIHVLNKFAKNKLINILNEKPTNIINNNKLANFVYNGFNI